MCISHMHEFTKQNQFKPKNNEKERNEKNLPTTTWTVKCKNSMQKAVEKRDWVLEWKAHSPPHWIEPDRKSKSSHKFLLFCVYHI